MILDFCLHLILTSTVIFATLCISSIYIFRTACIDGVSIYVVLVSYIWYPVTQYGNFVWLFPFPVFVDRMDPGRLSLSSCGELFYGDSHDENIHASISIFFFGNVMSNQR